MGKIITSKNSKLCRILYNSIAPKIDEGNPNNENRKFKWFRHIRKLLQELGYPGLWMTHDFCNIDWLYRSIQLRLKDNFLQDWSHPNGSSLKDYYLYIKTIFGLEEYLVKLPHTQRILIFCIRTSLLGIPVTLGRYDQTSYDQRACNICNSGDIGDEYHFLLECQLLHEIRNKHLPEYFWKYPNKYKFRLLLNSKNISLISKVAKFVKEDQRLIPKGTRG